MKNIFLVFVFCISSHTIHAQELDIAESIILTGEQTEYDMARSMVQMSQCIKQYEIKTETIIVDGIKQVVSSQTMVLRSIENSDKYFKIESTKAAGSGYGLIQVGAFSLSQCTDFVSK